MDVSYSTFWNDFSHYSLYQEGPASTETPIAYNDLTEFHELFEDKERYIDHIDQSMNGKVQFLQHAFSENRFEEKFVVNLDQKSHFYAHVPQDFNLELETHGNIRGVNLGDSKYLGSQTRFVTHGKDSVVAARRVRTDTCFIKT